jgi:hypothetical protein
VHFSFSEGHCTYHIVAPWLFSLPERGRIAMADEISPHLSVEIYLNKVGPGVKNIHSSKEEQIVPRFTASQAKFYMT